MEETRGKRKRGRPTGHSEQGLEMQARLYAAATEMIAQRGYAETTLREIAKAAGVSPGLLYRYFPSKRAVVLHLYDELSAEYASRAASMRPGKWRERFIFALRTSLEVLGPHRKTLGSLTGVLVGDAEEGLFAPSTAFSRARVQKAFHDAVSSASDAPEASTAAALGRLLYLVHLGVILWWLLDKSPQQRATVGLIKLMEQTLPTLAFSLKLGVLRPLVLSADSLVRDGLFETAAPGDTSPAR